MNNHQIAVVMGSHSDWKTMQHCCAILDDFNQQYLKQVVSAHRSPDLMFSFVEQARDNGIKIIIAAAGGAAHLPGMLAAKTTVPVIGVPIASQILNGIDSLLSIVQMPAGVPVATMAIGKAGAINAALFALAMLSTHDSKIATAIAAFRNNNQQRILDNPNPSQPPCV